MPEIHFDFLPGDRVRNNFNHHGRVIACKFNFGDEIEYKVRYERKKRWEPGEFLRAMPSSEGPPPPPPEPGTRIMP